MKTDFKFIYILKLTAIFSGYDKKINYLKIKILLIEALVAIFCLKAHSSAAAQLQFAYSYQHSDVSLLISFKKFFKK